MPTRKRSHELDEAEATKSDPDDFDYQDRPSPTKKPKPSRKSRTRTTRKRAEHGYAGSDVTSEDDLGSDSFGHSSSVDAGPVELTETGRPRRTATKKTTNFKESSDEESPEPSLSDASEDLPKGKPSSSRPVSRPVSRSKPTTSVANQPRRSLIVKLPVTLPEPQGDMDLRRRPNRSTAGGKSVPSGPAAGLRRSSRQSHDEQPPLLSLTDSGRHAQVARQGSQGPAPSSARQTRGRKQVPQSSAIIEASQEDSNANELDEVTEEVAEGAKAPLAEARSVGDDDDAQVSHSTRFYWEISLI